jgi:hypothetical protein
MFHATNGPLFCSIPFNRMRAEESSPPTPSGFVPPRSLSPGVVPFYVIALVTVGETVSALWFLFMIKIISALVRG